MTNTDISVKFHKETKLPIMQQGRKMHLYYTDEYVRWLESIAIKQANEDISAKKYGIYQNITNRRLIILSAVIGTIVGSFSTSIAFACW